MRILFIIDPLQKLDLPWDNSLYLLREFARRGHENWTADAGDVWADGKNIRVRAQKITPAFFHETMPVPRRLTYKLSTPLAQKVLDFDLVLFRKEPPVNESYLSLTYLLEQVADKVPVVNHPAGIRNTNEKLGILYFPDWIPETMISSSPEQILAFQKQTKSKIVLKPLNEKSGNGVVLLGSGDRRAEQLLQKATRNGKKFIAAQRYIAPGRHGEKRIVLLNGKILTTYEKRALPGDFRANLSIGATFHPSEPSAREQKLAEALRPYLLKNKLFFVGIDVLEEKLIDLNVTSPAGISESKFLYPKRPLMESWADSLERLTSAR